VLADDRQRAEERLSVSLDPWICVGVEGGSKISFCFDPAPQCLLGKTHLSAGGWTPGLLEYASKLSKRLLVAVSATKFDSCSHTSVVAGRLRQE